LLFLFRFNRVTITATGTSSQRVVPLLFINCMFSEKQGVPPPQDNSSASFSANSLKYWASSCRNFASPYASNIAAMLSPSFFSISLSRSKQGRSSDVESFFPQYDLPEPIKPSRNIFIVYLKALIPVISCPVI